MHINPVWLIFHHQDLILEKERKQCKKRQMYNNLETVYSEAYSNPVEHLRRRFFAKLVYG